MGLCELQKSTEKEKIKEESKKESSYSNKDNKIKEGNYHTHLQKLDSIITTASKSVCKLLISDKIKVSGFFIKFVKGNQDFYCLMTCAHCIDKRVMGDKNTIEILYDNGTKYIEINLDEREIHSFQNVHIDAVVFEILPKDNISKVYFLEPNLEYNKNNIANVIGKEIDIIEFPEDFLAYSYDIIYDIDPYNINSFITGTSVMPGSTGSPVFLKNSIKVIGMFGGIYEYENRRSTFNYFIFPINEYLRNLPENGNISKNNNNNLNDEINTVNKNEAISVHFMSSDQTINYSFPSYPNELFSIVVNKLFEKYPDYKNKTSHFICNAYYMKLNLTMKQNKYKSGDKIMVVINE